MKHLTDKIQTVCEPFNLGPDGIRIDVSPQKLASAWLRLESKDDLFALATAFHAAGIRLATTTVYQPDPKNRPDCHEVTYHFMLEGLPVTVTVSVEDGEALPSVTSLYPNADWEERELMELCDVPVSDHPNPRRLFLDESVNAGIFDKYVAMSELTNLANADAVWKRIREECQTADAGTEPAAINDQSTRQETLQ